MKEQELRGILSGNIKRCRMKYHLSQMALAEKLDVSTNFISDIEKCKSWISPKTLVKLASALEVEPYELLMADALISEPEKDILRQYADENIKAVLSVINRLREN